MPETTRGFIKKRLKADRLKWNGGKGLKNTAKLPPYQGFVRSTLAGEMGQHGVGTSGADDRHQLLARRSANTGKAAEGREERLAPPRPDPANHVELRLEIPLRPRQAMEGDREPVRLVADALDQQERR